MNGRPSLLDALRQTLQSGQMPEPQRKGEVQAEPAVAQAAPGIRQQLEQSLATRMPGTYVPGGPARAARPARRGSLAAALGMSEAEATPEEAITLGMAVVDAAVQAGFHDAAPVDPRAAVGPAESPGGVPPAVGRAAAAGDPAEQPLPFPPLTFPQADDGGCELPTYAEGLPLFCLINGQAGCGKTFWAKVLAGREGSGCVLAATTGIAAVNLGEGTTINALLRFFNTESLRDAYTGGFLESSLKKLRGAGLKRILLDEVSMFSGDQLTILTRALDNVNADRGAEDAELGLILVGDFCQLAPVKEPFAFESAEWGRYAEHSFRLTQIRRQADRPFIEALQAVRRGDPRRALEFFADRLQVHTETNFDGPTLVAKNDAVEKLNQLRLDTLKGGVLLFPSQRWGKLRPDWGGDPKPKHEWGIPEALKLKAGARVMILANHNIAGKGEPPEYLYVNGDLGTLLDQQTPGVSVRVRLDRTGDEVVVVPIVRDNVIPLEPGRRQALRAEGHPERIKERWEIIGGITYLPIRLAYATTTHKSQGLSLDKVQVNIRDHFFALPGMLYTALSRARTAEGLRLVGSPEGFRARCTVNKAVIPWL